VRPVGERAHTLCEGRGAMTMNVTVGETPIFDELRELFGQWELEELIGREASVEEPTDL
jgi:hypothetical protein